MTETNGATAPTDTGPPKDYEMVADRIRAFHHDYPTGGIAFRAYSGTDDYRINDDGTIEATAYVRAGEQLKGVGTARNPYPGTSDVTRGAEVQTVQTHAMGRALAAAGYPGRSVASEDEIRAHRADTGPPADRTLAGVDAIRGLFETYLPRTEENATTVNGDRVAALHAAGLEYPSVTAAIQGMTAAEFDALERHLAEANGAPA